MQHLTKSSLSTWPKPPKATSSASWPRYLRNAETRDHLAGKRLSAGAHCEHMPKGAAQSIELESQ